MVNTINNNLILIFNILSYLFSFTESWISSIDKRKGERFASMFFSELLLWWIFINTPYCPAKTVCVIANSNPAKIINFFFLYS
mgnify:CR=1 FL=1